MQEQLLSDWESRPQPTWGDGKIAELNREIEMLSALQKCGCEYSRDGLLVKMQLDERRELLREILRVQLGGR